MSFRFSEKFRVARFRNHYKSLYPTDITDSVRKFLRTIDSVDLSKPVLILNDNDYMRQSFLYMFMKLGFVDYKVMSAYSLLDIYLGNNEDISTVLDVSPDVLCLYLGYGEFENKRQVDIIIQVVQNQIIEGKKLWLFCRGNQTSINAKYPGLISYFKRSGYNIVSPEKLTIRSEEL